MQRDCFFTSIALNYLPKALALASSVFDAYPDSRFVVSLIDHQRLSGAQRDGLARLVEEFRSQGRELSFVDPLSLYKRADLFVYKFNVVEACTSVKPALAAALLETADTVTYLDPDTILYTRFPDEADASWDFQVTPHAVAPSDDRSLISERLFMFYGVFNLGYFAVRKSQQTLDFLNWWKDFCVAYGADAPQAGLFVDQKPVDLLPCFVDRVHVLRHPGCNVAWWNIFCDGRGIEPGGRVSFRGQDWPLVFYHFSNLHHPADASQRKIANPLGLHGDRRGEVSVLLSSYPALAALFQDYESRTQVLAPRCKDIGPIMGSSRPAPPVSVRLLLAEALRRGMTYSGDPAQESPRTVGWRSWRYIVRASSRRDVKTALFSMMAMLRLTLATSLLRFTN
ncbi:hypothetical protein [Roseateles chitinivorans]|uniref:hypothetical protein n=1 Tax=Roseateles chitinivorans TaxID=2917965 RepID=UPI003D664C06